MLRLLTLWAAALCLASAGQTRQLQQLPRVAPQVPANGPRYSVGGTAVNSATSEPLARALVQIFISGSHIALTGPDGHFQFDNLPAGAATVSAQKPGFFTPQELNVDQMGVPYPIVQVGPDTAPIVVKLLPAGQITGRVTDGNGEPLENVQIRALLKRVDNGNARWEERGIANTDDAGEYRIQNLIPGEYYVATGAKATHRLSLSTRQPGETFDTFYTSVFFPGASTLSSASAIEVNPGQEANADFTMPLEKTYRLSGIANGINPFRTSFMLLDSDGNRVPVPFTFDRKTSEFRFMGVVPGSYNIFVSSNQRRTSLFGIVAVAIGNADADNIQVSVDSAANIPVHLTFEDAGSQPPPAQPAARVHLTPRDRNLFNVGAWSRTENQDGQASESIPGVIPGRYRAEVQSMPNFYVSSLRSGASDLSRDDLVVPPGEEGQAIEVVMHGGAASLRGMLKLDDQPVRGYVIVLPDGASASEPPMIATSGQFTIGGLAPGSYHVYGFLSIKGLEYRNPEVMRTYESQATTVSLNENDNKELTVQLISRGRS